MYASDTSGMKVIQPSAKNVPNLTAIVGLPCVTLLIFTMFSRIIQGHWFDVVLGLVLKKLERAGEWCRNVPMHLVYNFL